MGKSVIRTRRLSSIISNHSKALEFQYINKEDEERAELQGTYLVNTKKFEPRKSSVKWEHGLKSSLVSNILKTSEEKHYDSGIKTYRLFDGDLYNIDLEDKEAYNEQF